MIDTSPPRHCQSFLAAGNPVAAIALAALVCMTGCNDGRPARVPVSGVVTIDGTPISGAFVVFYPHGGRASNGRTDTTGRYSLRCFEDNDGALIGSHLVTVIAVQELNPNTMKWYAPKKYADHKTSGLKFTVEKPTNDLNIALTWDGGKPFIERAGHGD